MTIAVIAIAPMRYVRLRIVSIRLSSVPVGCAPTYPTAGDPGASAYAIAHITATTTIQRAF